MADPQNATYTERGIEPLFAAPKTARINIIGQAPGLKGHEQVIGGGTFGRLLERGVAYGAMFPDSIDTMHQANEFIALDDLFRAAAIYAEAIYELIK